MKFNKLLILSILLLAVLTIAAVSANDNMTNEVTSTDETISTDEVISTDEASQDALSETIPHALEGDDWPSEIEVGFNHRSDEVLKDNPVYFSATLFSGKIDVSIDGKQRTSTLLGEDEVDAAYSVPTTGLGLGEHILNVKLSGSSYYAGANRNFTFFIKDIIVNVPESVNVEDDYGTDMYVGVNSEDSGRLVVVIDGATCIDDTGKKFSKNYNLNKLSAFDNPHIIKVTYTTAKGVIYDKTFTVNATYFQLQDRDLRYHLDQSSYGFSVPEGFDKAKLHVKIDDKAYNFTERYKDSGYYNVDIGNLGLGNHSLVVSYDGDNKFAPCSASATITVYPWISFSDDYITIDKKIDVSSEIPNSNCTLSVYVDGQLYCSTSFNNGHASVVGISGLKVGAHKIRADITGDYNYTYTKGVYVYVDIKGPGLLNVGESGNFIVNFPNANGKLTVDFGNVKVTGQFINGTANIKIPSTLKVGHHDVYFIYNDGNNSFNVSESLYIEPVFNVPKTVTNGNGVIYMTLPYDEPNGKLVVEIYNKKDKYVLSSKFVNKKASISLASINGGSYTVFPKYFDGSEWSYHGTLDMTVNNNKITASDLTMYYASSSAFKVKVTDYKGNIVKSKYVKFYIDGKYVKKVKTSKKGYATLKIGKAPGSYKITVKYGKVQITRNLTVKHAVTLKTVTVKKSAKKLVLKATLKAGKKALKNKKVTFKFNGKTYKVKTNKKGIAKVTIKKAVLKKLKVGKTVKYQATYGKDTVKKSTIVKK